MAKIYTVTPTGSVESFYFRTLNSTWTGGSSNGYIKLPNGLTIVYGRVGSNTHEFDNNGDIVWVPSIRTSWNISNFYATVNPGNHDNNYIASLYARYTNEKVVFTVWDVHGNRITSNPTPSFGIHVLMIDGIAPLYT